MHEVVGSIPTVSTNTKNPLYFSAESLKYGGFFYLSCMFSTKPKSRNGKRKCKVLLKILHKIYYFKPRSFETQSCTAEIVKSISFSVVYLEKEKRTAPRDLSSEKPIAFRMLLGFRSPLQHADPVEQ